MKKIIYLVVGVALLSCQTQEKNTHTTASDTTNAEKQVANKEYIDLSSVKIGFGAFKTTDKVEVKGWFEEFELSGVKQGAESLEEALNEAAVQIKVASLQTNNPDRNQTILTTFFAHTLSSQTIEAKVLRFNSDSSVASLRINFNGVEKVVPFNYTLNGDTLQMKGILLLAEVNDLKALAYLNKACKELHKGSDGVSKTWNEVNLYVNAIVKRD